MVSNTEYLFLTPNSRSVFCAGVSLNIHSFILIHKHIETLAQTTSQEFIGHIKQGSIAAFTLPQKLARLNRAGLGPDLAHFSGTVYIATKTSSVDPSPVRGARLYVLPFYSFLVE